MCCDGVDKRSGRLNDRNWVYVGRKWCIYDEELMKFCEKGGERVRLNVVDYGDV